MYSVTKRIGTIKQPYGGYLRIKDFNATVFDDGKVLNPVENISPSLVGLAVDYLTRFMLGAELKDAFRISLIGAGRLSSYLGNIGGDSESVIVNSYLLYRDIKGLDYTSVINAYKLVGYDSCARGCYSAYKSVEEINPDDYTIENIITMVERGIKLWENYGDVVKSGFTFDGGYTGLVSSGDGDYLTRDTLWDFKVSKNEPKIKDTLQLLMYYIMGKHSIHAEFKTINKLGIFNPRKNKAYIIDTSLISLDTINQVSEDVIGYT